MDKKKIKLEDIIDKANYQHEVSDPKPTYDDAYMDYIQGEVNTMNYRKYE